MDGCERARRAGQCRKTGGIRAVLRPAAFHRRHRGHSCARRTSREAPATILDLGCGTGAAGAAWALACQSSRRSIGIDRHPWAIDEAQWTYQQLGVRRTSSSGRRRALARTAARRGRRGGLRAQRAAGRGPDHGREAACWTRSTRGGRVLVIEPIARGIAPWWDDAAAAFQRVRRTGGRVAAADRAAAAPAEVRSSGGTQSPRADVPQPVRVRHPTDARCVVTSRLSDERPRGHRSTRRTQQPSSAHTDRPRRRLRGYRNKSPVRDPRGLLRIPRRAADATRTCSVSCRSCSTRCSSIISIKYIVVVMRADNQGEGGILALTALLPRPRRGQRRHAWRRPRSPDSHRARHFRRRAPVRRRHDHAGDQHSGRRRRAVGRHTAVHQLGRADIRGHSDWPVRHSAARHAPGRATVRSGDGGVVRDHRAARRRVDPPRAASARGVRSQTWRDVLSRERLARLHGARHGLPRRHRRRGAVRGHGAFRQGSDSNRVVRAGPARAAAELFRAGCAAPHQCERHAALLPDGSLVGAAAVCRPLHVGGRDRLTGAHLRRLLGDAAGDSARLHATPRRRAHVGSRDGTDLRSAGELGADGLHDCDRDRLRVVGQTVGRLRNGGRHGHGHHRPSCSTW